MQFIVPCPAGARYGCEWLHRYRLGERRPGRERASIVEQHVLGDPRSARGGAVLRPQVVQHMQGFSECLLVPGRPHLNDVSKELKKRRVGIGVWRRSRAKHRDVAWAVPALGDRQCRAYSRAAPPAVTGVMPCGRTVGLRKRVIELVWPVVQLTIS